jgi:hypothetical protein
VARRPITQHRVTAVDPADIRPSVARVLCLAFATLLARRSLHTLKPGGQGAANESFDSGGGGFVVGIRLRR